VVVRQEFYGFGAADGAFDDAPAVLIAGDDLVAFLADVYNVYFYGGVPSCPCGDRSNLQHEIVLCKSLL